MSVSYGNQSREEAKEIHLEHLVVGSDLPFPTGGEIPFISFGWPSTNVLLPKESLIKAVRFFVADCTLCLARDLWPSCAIIIARKIVHLFRVQYQTYKELQTFFLCSDFHVHVHGSVAGSRR